MSINTKENLNNFENTSEMVKSMKSFEIDQNLNEVLATVKVLDNICKYQNCRTKISLFGDVCKYCTDKFCFKHNLPEVHGCEEMARKTERREFTKAKSFKQIQKEEDLEKARDKLHAKLKDMNISRKIKPNKKK